MKYYNGNELKWSTDDVMLNAEHLDVKLTEEEAESILIATFEDNEAIMQFINEEIADTIREKIKDLSKYICGSCGDRVNTVAFNEDKDVDECVNCM